MRLKNLPCDIDIKGIACDSRKVSAGDLFVALHGTKQDGHKYILEAIKKGAVAIVLDEQNGLKESASDTPFVFVKNSNEALKNISDEFFGFPYGKIKWVGITGTNGKTTVSFLIRSILKAAGKKSGLIGTIGYQVLDVNKALSNTTPGPLELRSIAAEMLKSDNEFVVMEVSSHALDQGRTQGIVFSASIFTNLTQDHLDYHRDMEEYFTAKKLLFTEYSLPDSKLIINLDDPFGARLIDSLNRPVLSYGFSDEAVVGIKNWDLSIEGCRAEIRTPKGEFKISTPLVGKHNLYNILASVAYGVSLGLDNSVIKSGIESVRAVAGRLERLDSSKGFSVFVDYAHTDDALKNVLESLRHIIHNGRIITVFGCGGDRDKTKRPKMGRVASELSDFCVVTTDNPRSEDPNVIIGDIVSGIGKKNYFIEADRLKAIRNAINMAHSGDIVLIAGKGHETYQIVKQSVSQFDDKKVAHDIIGELA